MVVGLSDGHVMCKTFFHRPAPSTSATSYSVGSIAEPDAPPYAGRDEDGPEIVRLEKKHDRVSAEEADNMVEQTVSP